MKVKVYQKGRTSKKKLNQLLKCKSNNTTSKSKTEGQNEYISRRGADRATKQLPYLSKRLKAFINSEVRLSVNC